MGKEGETPNETQIGTGGRRPYGGETPMETGGRRPQKRQGGDTNGDWG